MNDSDLPSKHLPAPDMSENGLPEIEDACALLERTVPEPPELVEGILHRGSKLVLGGSSKTNKTWCLLDLALSVAAGQPWLSYKTTKGRVLYVNLEIQAAFFRRRVKAVIKAKGITLRSSQLDVWNLRGYAAPYSTLFPRICEQAQVKGHVLIVIDPIYKVYGNLRENDAADVAQLLNAVEKLGVDADAAVAFGAHFSKGNQAGKESIDRISGSGVFARDPDSILVMTAHKEPQCFTVEATLRNFKPVEPFVIRWQYPLMRRDNSLNPGQLKQARGGRKTTFTCEQLLASLGETPITNEDWQRQVCEKTTMSRSTFFERRKELEEAGKISMDANGKWSKNGSPDSPK